MNPKAREFENDTYLKAELERLVAGHKVRSIIETGTEYGGSANCFARMEGVQVVVTIDIKMQFDRGDLLPNVFFIHGPSEVKLQEAIDYVLEPGLLPILFFLDAHTSIDTDDCPLRKELSCILSFAQGLEVSPPVIVIHDCVVPGKKFGFDTYRDGPICWEYVEDQIEAIFPRGYTKHYNSQAAGSMRGCLFVTPL